MKRTYFLFILFILSFSIQAQPEIKVTMANVNFRSSPDTGLKNKICIIIKGTKLLINNENQNYSDWILVDFNGRKGYVNEKYLKTPQSDTYSSNFKNFNSNERVIKYYINSDGVKVQSPTKYDKSPVGACAECWDGTYSFSLHRRGTCSHHGGVKRWL